MNQQEHIAQCHQRIAEWFSNHEAQCRPVLNSDRKIFIIEWRRPDVSDYWMRFTIDSGYVIVTGDVGEAIYGFHRDVTLEDFLSFDWHYFTGKCCASETGRQYTQKVPGIKTPVVNIRALGHHAGLQMALRKLQPEILG